MTPQGGASGMPPRWRALLASTALAAVSIPVAAAMPLAALLTSLTTTPAMANGGAGSAGLSAGGAGGIDSPTGPGGTGGTALGSGGGGGAGATGGDGGNSGVAGGGTGGTGGSSAGSAGAAGGDGSGIASGGGGGGGGAHGFVDATLPGAASTGGAGGKGGNGGGFLGDGGGGGAGGYGAVVTGTGSLGTLGAAVTGGAGGSGGDGRNAGDGGTGGIGLFFANAATFTVDAAVQGGTGGAGGTGIERDGSAGAGGAGIVGQSLAITMGAAGTVAGGSGANAITFTGGANTLTFNSATSGLTGNIGVTGSLTFDQSSIGTTVANVITGDGSVAKTGTSTITLSGANSYTGGTMVNAGTLALTGAGTLGATTNAVTVNGATAVLDLGGTTQTQNGGVVVQGGGTIQNGTLSSSGTFDMQSGTVTAVLAGTGGVSKTTAGTVTFSGANTYTGGTAITAGTLALAGAGTLGAATNAVTVNGATAVLDLGGTTQTQNGGVVLQGGGTIQNGTLSSSGTFDMQSGTVSAVLAGTGGVSKTTAGMVTFSGANTYTGGTTITAGTLVAASNGALPTATNVAVNSGGTLEIGNGIAARISSLAGDGAVVIGSSVLTTSTSLRIGGTSGNPSTTFSGSITGAGSLRLSRGSLTLTGASSIGGDLTVDSGTTLRISGAGASFEVGGLPSGIDGVDVRGTLNVQNGGTFTTNILALSGSMTISGASATANGITSVGTIPVFSPAASLRIENGGTLNSVGDAFITNLFSRPSVTVTGTGSVWQVGGSLDVGDRTASFGLAGALTVSNGGVVNVAGTTSIAGFPGVGSSILTVTGAGSALNSTSLAIGAVAGGSNLAGVLTVAEGGVVNAAGGTTIRAAGTLNLGTGGLAGSIVTPTIANGGQIVANFTDTLTLAADISGTGRLSKSGTGTLTLTGTNTYLGGTTISGGTLAIFQDANLGAASGPLTFGGGTLQAQAGFSTVRAITLNVGGGTIDTNGNAVTASGPIGGVGGLTKIGAGTLTLSGNNTYSGGTVLQQGTLRLEHDSALGTGALTTLGSVVDYANGVTIANPIILNSNDTQLQVLTGTATQSGDISETVGPRPLEKIGAGTLVLTGANTYTGPTTISAGTLVAGSNGALPMATDVAVNGGAALEIGDGIVARINSLAGGGALVIGSSDPTTYLGVGFNGGATTTFSGSITGAGSLDLVGGSLTLTGASSISGDLTVCGCATLTISGPGASFAVTGNPFGLGGTEIDGTLNVLNSGTFTTNDLAVVGSMTVSGANSTATVNGLTLVGAIPSFTPASLRIENGGRMNSVGGAIIANDFSVPNVTVTGMGSVWQIGTALEVGDTFLSGLPGSLTISDRGVVNVSGTTTIASDPLVVGLGPSTLTVTGAGSALNAESLVIGTAGCGCGPFEGVLTIAEGGVVRATTGTQIGVLGVLNLGSGGLAGSIVTPTIVNEGQIVANFTDVATLSAAISGTGTLSKFGSGTLILSGNSTYTGSTSVVAGGLIVNGSVVSPVTVESGAFLGGTGSVGSTTINGGTLSPGNSIGTLTINGNLVLSSASAYLVEVNAAGQSDRTNVTGTATLGGTVQVVAAPGTYAPGTTYTILNATGGISGTFGGLTSNLASSDFLSPTLAYDSNNVFLSLAQTATLASAGRTRNQIATGTGVDSLGFGNPISDTLLLGTAAQARAAFDLLSGEVHASAAGVMLDESRYVRDAVIGRARQSYGGPQSGVLAALGPTTAAIAYAQETENAFAALGYAAGKRPVYKAAPAAPTPNERVWAAWSQAIGAWGKTDGDGNAAALDRTVAGFVSGVDATFNGLWRLGLAGGYTRSSLDVDARRSSAAMDNFHVALYGGTQQGPWGLRGGAAFTWHEIDTRRTIAFPGFFDATKANYNAHTAQVFGEIGYGIALGPTAALEPFAAVAYVNLDTDRFTETGGAASLAGSTTLDATFTTLGLRGATVLGFANGMAVTARGTLGWRHAFGDATPEMSLTFVSGGIPFTIAGAPLAKNSAVVEAGLDLAVTANAKLGVIYSGQLADTAQDHAVKGNFLWRF